MMYSTRTDVPAGNDPRLPRLNVSAYCTGVPAVVATNPGPIRSVYLPSTLLYVLESPSASVIRMPTSCRVPAHRSVRFSTPLTARSVEVTRGRGERTHVDASLP